MGREDLGMCEMEHLECLSLEQLQLKLQVPGEFKLCKVGLQIFGKVCLFVVRKFDTDVVSRLGHRTETKKTLINAQSDLPEKE